MDHLKYVITERNGWAIFNNLQKHSEVGHSLYGKPISGGFIQLKHTKDKILVECWGESISLSLKSRPKEDAEIISEHMN